MSAEYYLKNLMVTSPRTQNKQTNKHSLTTVVNAVLIWGMFRGLRFLMGQFIIRGMTFHTGTGSVNLAHLCLYQTDNLGDNIYKIRDIAKADSYFL